MPMQPADLEATVEALWCEMFAVERIGKGETFFTLGGDSWMAVQIANKLSERFAIQLSVSQFFQSPTVQELAQLIARLQEEQLNPRPAEEFLF